MSRIIIKGNEIEKMLERINRSFNENVPLILNDIEIPRLLKKEIMKAYRFLKKADEDEKKGIFIVVTGVDKTGKETHTFNPSKIKEIVSIKEFLEKQGYLVLGIRQPSYETPLGSLVGAYLGRMKTDYIIDGRLDVKYAWILWSLDRAQHVQKVREWLRKNEKHIVLSKRWTESNVIYQYFNGIPSKEVLNIEKNVPKPDYILVIDIPYDELVRRLNRARKDDYEKIEFLKRIREAYLELPKYYPYGEVFLVSGKGSIRETNRRIISCISEIIDRF